MLLRRFVVAETGCASYLLGCPTHGRFAVVDPHLDLVDDYLSAAAGAGGELVAAIDTHVHADHPSGATELARAAGARLLLPDGAPVEFEFEPLRDGDDVELGNTVLEVVATPGHAWAHVALVVRDLRRGDEPWAVLTGDALFVGSVGRPDLHGDEAELAAALERSLHERLLALPDWVELLPGHVGGSACGAGISGNPSSTIGFERRANPLLAERGERFTRAVLDALAPAPPEFARIYETNRRGGAPAAAGR